MMTKCLFLSKPLHILGMKRDFTRRGCPGNIKQQTIQTKVYVEVCLKRVRNAVFVNPAHGEQEVNQCRSCGGDGVSITLLSLLTDMHWSSLVLHTREMRGAWEGSFQSFTDDRSGRLEKKERAREGKRKEKEGKQHQEWQSCLVGAAGLKERERFFHTFFLLGNCMFYVHTSTSDRWFALLDESVSVFFLFHFCYWAKMWVSEIRESASQHENCHNLCSKPVSHKVEQVCNNMMVQKPFQHSWMFFSQNCWKKGHNYLYLFVILW